MNNLPSWNDETILAARPPKNAVSADEPYACLVEPERQPSGAVQDVATVFLTNRECPFRCLMCDLWKNTLSVATPPGAIPRQIDYALERLAPAQHIKLYNSGNFFDPLAIPPADHAAIADRVQRFQTVIVENHPRLCNDRCVRFRDRLSGDFEIALGLETIHPQVLPRLNKRMTLDDFDHACEFLSGNGIQLRAFVLLKPPFLDEDAGIEWAVRSVEHAFDVGVECCALIPTRATNGIMQQIAREGHFSEPALTSLEAALEAALSLNRGRVFADLWDVERFSRCDSCRESRAARLAEMNLTQTIPPTVSCSDCRC